MLIALPGQNNCLPVAVISGGIFNCEKIKELNNSKVIKQTDCILLIEIFILKVNFPVFSYFC